MTYRVSPYNLSSTDQCRLRLALPDAGRAITQAVVGVKGQTLEERGLGECRQATDGGWYRPRTPPAHLAGRYASRSGAFGSRGRGAQSCRSR